MGIDNGLVLEKGAHYPDAHRVSKHRRLTA